LNDPSEGRLMVVAASGGTPRDLLPGHQGHVDQVAWRDASTILYRASERVRTVVATLGVGGGEPNVVLPAGDLVWTDVAQLAGGALALVGESARHPGEVYRLAAGGAPERLTDSNPWLAERDLAAQEVVTFEARDGLELDGILIRPLGEVEGNRYPLILAVHGGPEAHHSNGWMTSYSNPGQVAAARGFAVFYTNYRGSTGRGVAFSKLSQADPAGLEFQDLVDAVDHLVSTGLVDAAKVGITGGSYGGYATAWGSTYYSERFAAGVMFVGISDKVAKLGMSDIPREEYEVHAREWPWEDWRKMLERSPIYHVEKSKTPLLIMGGTADTRVNPAHSLILYRYLQLLGNAPVRYVRYPGEPHGNRKAAARLDYNLRMLRWFEHYLQGPGVEPPAADLDYVEPVEGGMGADDDDETDEADDEAMDEKEMEEDQVEDRVEDGGR
jgi:dipeptidyl aminopeptidase/acylaminoacyl peptidase